MGRKVYGFFAIMCVVLLVFAACFAAIRIGGEIRDNTHRAQGEFDHMIQSLSRSWNNSLQDEIFRQTIRDNFWESPTLMALLVSGSSGPELAMEKENGLIVLSDASPQLNSSIAWFSNGLSASLHGAGAQLITIEALAMRFDHNRMRGILSQALIILIASVLLALFVFLIAHSAGKSHTAAVESEPSRDSGMNLDDSIPGLSPDVLPDMELPRSDTNGGEIPREEGIAPRETREREPAIARSQPDNAPVIPAETAHTTQEALSPEGLYNPQSGIGWESYLPERLNAELHRAASFEQDLVLLIWDSLDPRANEEQRAALAGELVRFFSFRDLSFEFGKSGASVILPNMDLDHGLRMAEEFIQQLSRRATKEPGVEELRCGVASRHGRLLEPGRLLMEAQGALKRACADPATAVIAFRSDPERYRELLKKG